MRRGKLSTLTLRLVSFLFIHALSPSACRDHLCHLPPGICSYVCLLALPPLNINQNRLERNLILLMKPGNAVCGGSARHCSLFQVKNSSSLFSSLSTLVQRRVERKKHQSWQGKVVPPSSLFCLLYKTAAVCHLEQQLYCPLNLSGSGNPCHTFLWWCFVANTTLPRQY